MKTLILSVRDTGGTGWTLAHAINKHYPDHPTINLRGMNTYLNYPCFVDMGNYSRTAIREMIYNSDVIMFLGAMKPFFDALKLNRKNFEDKKNILLCMGSEWRWGRDKLLAQADKLLGEYKVVLGGADMFVPVPIPQPDGSTKITEPVGDEVEYLPVVRSFQEIGDAYTICNQDKTALKAFAQMKQKKKVVYVHAPTSEATKGTEMFYAAITHANQVCPNMGLTTIRQHPWVSCLQTLAQCDVLLDQAPPFPTAYGALSVEAAIFHLPSFSQVSQECQEWIKRKTGLTTPYVTFSDGEDLFRKIVRVTQDEQLRKELGEMNYEYCKKLHDEKPVADRFFKIVEAI